MELTHDQRQARFFKESGGQAMSSAPFAIGIGFLLLAFAGLGFGLMVLGICLFFDGLRTVRRGQRIDAEISTRLAGGRAPYPWQAATPNSDEYQEFREDSDLLRFGRFFFKAWFVLWIPTMALLVALLGS